MELVEDAKKAYADYTKRGEELVTEIRTSEATVEAEKQVKTATSKTKAAGTTAKKSAASTTRARKAATTSTRKAAEAVAEAVEDAADTVGK
jgi:cell division septum initiation protein DivIVA